MNAYVEMANEVLPDDWEALNESMLLCPCGHTVEWDGSCKHGHESPLKGMGLI